MKKSFKRTGKIPFKSTRKAPFKKTGKVPFKRASSESRVDEVLTVILIIAIIIAISLTVYVIVTPKQGEKFTEFYILSPNGTAADYPTDLKVGEAGEVIIGIVNHEYANTSYRMEVELNEEVINETAVVLSHNDTLESSFVFKAKTNGTAQKLEFLLYKDKEQPVYRSLHLWLDVNGE